MRTRVAPTPSGYLHAGNVANILVIDALARASDGTVILRIDDMDAPRYRADYVEDLVSVLRWVDVEWHEGPRDLIDFESAYRMSSRTPQYRDFLRTLTAGGLRVYACVCSRSQAAAAGTRGCAADCRSAGRPFAAGASALRAAVPEDTQVRIGERVVRLDREFGDPVLWRRDDLPAYHLASVEEDLRSGVTDIVRGSDLLPSSALQAWLASHAPGPGLSEVTFWHHDLLTGPSEVKLSKSQAGTPAVARTPDQAESLRATASRLRASMASARASIVPSPASG